MYTNKEGYLLLVPHRATTTDHDLAAGLLLKLLRRHATGTKYTSNKVVLLFEERRMRNRLQQNDAISDFPLFHS